jgi:hypothetical protein
MSLVGQSRRSGDVRAASGLPRLTDIPDGYPHVSNVPRRDDHAAASRCVTSSIRSALARTRWVRSTTAGARQRIERSQKRLPARRVEPKMLTIGQSFPCAIQRALQHELADRAPGGSRGGVQHPLRFRRKSSFSDLVALAMMTSADAPSGMFGLLCHDIVWRIFLFKAPAPICARAAMTPIHPGRRPSPRGRAGSRSLAARAPE